MAYKPEGWRNKRPDDSFRHAQAAKGIKMKCDVDATRQTLREMKKYLSMDSKSDVYRLAAIEDTLDVIDELEGTLLARGVIIVESKTAEWPKEYTIDGRLFQLISIQQKRRTADSMASDIRAGKGRRPFGTDVRVAFGGADVRPTLAGKGLHRRPHLRNVGGYQQGEWALYERKK